MVRDDSAWGRDWRGGSSGLPFCVLGGVLRSHQLASAIFGPFSLRPVLPSPSKGGLLRRELVFRKDVPLEGVTSGKRSGLDGEYYRNFPMHVPTCAVGWWQGETVSQSARCASKTLRSPGQEEKPGAGEPISSSASRGRGTNHSTVNLIPDQVLAPREKWTCPALVERHRVIRHRFFRTEPGL
jgi:hypothetical protein